MRRPIAISLSPNTEASDVFLALKLFFSPWFYFGNSSIKSLELWFREYFGVSYAVTFQSGRGAFLAILKSLEIGSGDEVILQAFTCVVVADAILATGAKVVYVDTTSYFTMDPKDLERKITKKTKAVLAQHTFGIPTDMEEVLFIARKHKLFVIEDVAHTIGGEYKGKKLGTFGIASFFSFGRDKAFSSVFGGMAIINDQTLGKKLRMYQKNLQKPTYLWTVQQLFHPIAFSIILPFYHFFSIGKVLLLILQKLRLLSFPVSSFEKKGEVRSFLVKKMPNELAVLAVHQLKRVKEFNQKRELFTRLYLEQLPQFYHIPFKKTIPFLRFPILVKNKELLSSFFKKRGILLGDWYSNIIDPKGSDLEKVSYTIGLCPKAEELAKKVVNLPTYPAMTKDDALKVIGLLKDYANNQGNN